MQVITSEKDLREFLWPLVPRQKLRIVPSRKRPGMATELAEFIVSGLFTADPIVTATLFAVGHRGSWGDELGGVVEVSLSNNYTQPHASALLAKALWTGIERIEAIET